MHRFRLAAGAFVIVLAAPGAPVYAADAEAHQRPAALTIHIKNFTFSPTPVKIHAGDTISFVNDDDEAHTATAADKSFDSTGLDSGATWQHVFLAPGTYNYFCELHPYMKATIVVVPAASRAH